MKLTYVILTCESYQTTRCEWVRQTWLRALCPDDTYMFLSSIPNPTANIVGWHSLDTYAGCSQKYLDFVRNIDLENSDWIVFVDDDTFVFPSRIRSMLETYMASEQLYIGKLLNGPIPTMSGGAGFCISKALFREIQAYVREKPIQLNYIYSDVSIAQWIMQIPGAVYIWDRRFNSHPHTEEGSVETALTFHFVTEPLFREYYKYLQIN